MSVMNVYQMFKEIGYFFQANVKTKEGKEHPDRDAKFKYIYVQVKDFIKSKVPVISVVAKKKENVDEFKNVGQKVIKRQRLNQFWEKN